LLYLYCERCSLNPAFRAGTAAEAPRCLRTVRRLVTCYVGNGNDWEE